MTTLRLAIVGAGPAGIYAADILLKAERAFDVSIDLFEQLPAPYGLVRYGVAPDHPRIKGVITALREVLDRGDIRIFGNVEFVFYSGAALSEPVLRAFDAVSVAATGFRTPIMSAYGATETAPFALVANWPSEETGLAGVPLPGVELKLAPSQGKLEARLKGPNVTPGYWHEPERTREAFDEEGFLRFGDAIAFVGDDPALGLRFDGRLSEDFKLSTGTWVNVGALRAAFLAEAGMAIHDVVICGEGRDDVGALVFLSPQAVGGARTRVQEALDRLAARGTGSSTFIARAIVLAAPPAADAGEITDKGSLNARAVLANRSADLAALYAEPPGDSLMRAARPGTT